MLVDFPRVRGNPAYRRIDENEGQRTVSFDTASPAYEPRAARWHGLASSAGTTLKVYTIAEAGRDPGAPVVAEVLEHVPTWIGRARGLELHGAGVLIAHQGSDGLYCVLGLWGDVNVLHLQAFRRLEGAAEFADLVERGGAVCVWEFPVLQFESNAWRENCVKLPRTPESLRDYWGMSCSYTF